MICKAQIILDTPHRCTVRLSHPDNPEAYVDFDLTVTSDSIREGNVSPLTALAFFRVILKETEDEAASRRHTL